MSAVAERASTQSLRALFAPLEDVVGQFLAAGAAWEQVMDLRCGDLTLSDDRRSLFVSFRARRGRKRGAVVLDTEPAARLFLWMIDHGLSGCPEKRIFA